jgi:transposase
VDDASPTLSHLGLVPSEDSTGETRRQGAITKTGSGHGRRLLVEAASHCRRAPAKAQVLKRRQAANLRTPSRSAAGAAAVPHRSWRRLDSERGKRRTIVAVALARELAGFCWAAATAD